ncbi:GNAT family N-acetyltransferase [Halorubellus sp. JP-L1]|uniref:GNAT family N-acetyltransferase n=1 Tax=Halorubellus sp. JP-L1 TaxID=2715753 RepID=UPI00140E7C14|nr:GNAT family N-acetyltransferase [Halorubellus sp. JP-L1]NHN41348.1 GNAT family N-acetyltransferase [Halorubellus sp. JP-L1]
MDVTIRPYDPNRDRDALWELKAGFERGLGAGTGDDAKEATYEDKLTAAYRADWLAWVERCVGDDERCVTVASAPDEAGEDALLGYVFVLPERLAFVWDAAVLNEVFVVPDARGTGVADDLVDAAVSLARDQSLPLDRLVLDVDRENERAKAFYDRHGFAHWGEMVAKEL